MMRFMLARVIQETFMEKVGKFQGEDGKCLLVTFRTHRSEEDYVMDIYRHLDLLLYAPGNYVQVWIRELSTKSTTEPATWYLVGDHDSAWREGIDTVLNDYEDRLQGFGGSLASWYQVVAVPRTLDRQNRYKKPPTLYIKVHPAK